MHCLVSLVLWMLLSFLMSPLWIFCWVLRIELLPCLVETDISMLKFLGSPSTYGRVELLRTQIGVGLFLLTFVLFVLLWFYFGVIGFLEVPWCSLFCLFLWWIFVFGPAMLSQRKLSRDPPRDPQWGISRFFG